LLCRYLILEVAVAQVHDDVPQGRSEVGVGNGGPPRVIRAAFGLGRGERGQIALAQGIQVTAHTGADGQEVGAGFLDDAEETEVGEDPHGHAS
jgi:hypothetical protein